MFIGFYQATPKLSEDKVKQCVDVRLKGEYPSKSVAKVIRLYSGNGIYIVFSSNNDIPKRLLLYILLANILFYS